MGRNIWCIERAERRLQRGAAGKPIPLLPVGSMAAGAAAGIEHGPAVLEIRHVRREVIGAHLGGSAEEPQETAEQNEQERQKKPRSFHCLRTDERERRYGHTACGTTSLLLRTSIQLVTVT